MEKEQNEVEVGERNEGGIQRGERKGRMRDLRFLSMELHLGLA